MPEYKLTKKQQEVVEQMLKGLTTKEAAIVLNVADSTVTSHLRRIYKKMGVQTNLQMVIKLL